MRYIIYKITNQINGKIYIGKHKTERLDDDYFGSGLALNHAIKKYGIKNFTFHLEFELQNEDELNLLEKCVVNEEFLKRKDVYNLREGGYCGRLSEESKRKISESLKGRYVGEKNSFYGKRHTEQTLQKLRRPKTEIEKQHMRENHYDCIGSKNPMYGKDFQDYMSKEDIERRKLKCRNARLGKITITNGVCCKMWDKNIPIPEGWVKWKMNESMKDKLSKVIYQYSLDLNFIQSYKSLTECSKQTGISRTSISNCCNGKQNSSCGFIFVFSEDLVYFN